MSNQPPQVGICLSGCLFVAGNDDKLEDDAALDAWLSDPEPQVRVSKQALSLWV